MDLVEAVHLATRDWPKEERFGLTDQVRRAVVSVPANVAEGQGRGSRKDFLHFCNIATGSLYEVETHLLIGRRLGYLDEQLCETLLDQAAEIGRVLHGLKKSLRPPSAPDADY
jgi:four helix bundle protein